MSGAALQHVLFYRTFRGFRGGHLKVWDYYQHVQAAPGFRATVRFTRHTRWDASNPWLAVRAEAEERRRRVHPDVRFLAGRDWEKVPTRERADSPMPVVNLIQHVRHAEPDDPRFPFLAHRAIRICVSEPVADALRRTGAVRGPVLTIPAAIDLASLPAAHPPDERPIDVLVVATKRPEQGELVHERLARPSRTTRLVAASVPRGELLDALASARVSVFLPHVTEGFFLPSLEGMALGTLVVCPDCVGNRDHCLPGQNAFRPAYDLDEIVEQAEFALGLGEDAAGALRAAALETAAAHDLAGERAAFHDVLGRLDELWGAS